MPRKTTLEGYLRRLSEESSSKLTSYEKSLRRSYTSLLSDMNNVISNTYAKLDDNDMLNSLMKYNRKDNVEGQLNNLINEFSKSKYKGMYSQLKGQVTHAYDYYHTALTEVTGKTFQKTPLKAEWLAQTIENEVSGLTLKQTLQRDRQNIIYSIKSNLIQGVNRGESFSSMAKRMKDVLNGDYKKAVRIARTETHRVREAGTYESALMGEKAGIKQVKTWNSSNDSRTRKEHRRLDGETIPLDEYFQVGRAKALKPGDTGRAEHDINCRCFLTYEIVDDADTETPKETEAKKENTMRYTNVKTRQEAEQWVKDNFHITADYKGFRLDTANAVNETLVHFKDVFGDKMILNKICALKDPYKDGTIIYGQYTPMTGTIEFATKSMGGLGTAAKKSYKKMSSSTDSPYHHIRHEMGHAVERWCRENNPKTISTIRDMLKYEGITKDDLSSYGLTTPSEFIAECVAEYMNGNPRRVAKTVTELLLKG